MKRNFVLLNYNLLTQCTGYTPLLTACEYGRFDTVKVLKAEGANLHASTRLSHNAMELCDWYGHTNSFKEVDARLPGQHTQVMEQQLAYNPGAIDMAAAQFMHMAVASRGTSAAGMQAEALGPSTAPAMSQPQPMHYSGITNHPMAPTPASTPLNTGFSNPGVQAHGGGEGVADQGFS
jgi:hypothetical protein